MTLSRARVVDAAVGVLNDFGLESLSMRRLATELGVQPGALYWHVKSKQDLLAAIANRIVDGATRTRPSTEDPMSAVRSMAADFRAALLNYRDGAEIVTLAQALTDTPLPVRHVMRSALEQVMDATRAQWTAQALTHYVLGATSEEQSHAELTRAGVVAPGSDDTDALPRFLFGVDALLLGASRLDGNSGT